MVCSSTCLVMSSSLCIAPWFLKSTSAGACTAKTLCWPAVITAKQIFVKKYRTMVIVISKSRFGSISIDRISTASSFWTFCSLTSNLKSDDPNTTRTCYVSTLHAFYPISNYLKVTDVLNTEPRNLSKCECVGYFKNSCLLTSAWKVTLNKIGSALNQPLRNNN